jgi:hypothetical protein
MNEYSESFSDLLRTAGWTVERSVRVDHWLEQLTSEGFQVHEHAIAVLSNLGNLKVQLPVIPGTMPYAGEINFEPVLAGSGEFDRVQNWQPQLRCKLFPIGEESFSGNVIWLADDGEVFYGRGFGLYRLGTSLRKAMDTLAFGTDEPTKCAD